MGPWEWDLKRLAVSLVLAGRGNGASDEDSRVAVLAAVRAYRKVAESFRDTSVLDLWRLAVDDHSPAPPPLRARRRRLPPGLRVRPPPRQRGRALEADRGRRRAPALPLPRRRCSRRLEPDVRRDIVAGLAGYRRSTLPTTAHRAGRPRHRRRGAEGRGRRQRRHPGLRRAPGPTGRERSAVPAAQGGRALGRAARRRPPRAGPRGRADRGRSAPDAGRQRPLPRLDDRAGRALLRAAAQGPQGLHARSTS